MSCLHVQLLLHLALINSIQSNTTHHGYAVIHAHNV